MLGLNGLILSSSEGCGSVWGYFIVHGELELHIEKKSNTRNHYVTEPVHSIKCFVTRSVYVYLNMRESFEVSEVPISLFTFLFCEKL